jgi:D-hydroxyproline dehydrogenase subunit gamma
VSVTLNGQSAEFIDGTPVAVALLQSGVPSFNRSARHGQPRLPFCLMGICFECRVEIDGKGDTLACLIPVRAGMNIKTADS